MKNIAEGMNEEIYVKQFLALPYTCHVIGSVEL